MSKRPTLTKQRLVRTIGLRTGIRDVDVSQVIEAFIETVTEEIAHHGRLELQNFLVLEVQTRTRIMGKVNSPSIARPVQFRTLRLRPGRNLRAVLRDQKGG